MPKKTDKENDSPSAIYNWDNSYSDRGTSQLLLR